LRRLACRWSRQAQHADAYYGTTCPRERVKWPVNAFAADPLDPSARWLRLLWLAQRSVHELLAVDSPPTGVRDRINGAMAALIGGIALGVP
jgi:hypothetical protein